MTSLAVLAVHAAAIIQPSERQHMALHVWERVSGECLKSTSLEYS